MEIEARPRNLDEFVQTNNLTIDSTKSGADLKLDSDEEIWVFNISKSIKKEDLKEKIFSYKKKSIIELNELHYEVSKTDAPEEEVPCIYKNNDGDLKMVLLKPTMTVQILKKC